MRNLIVCGIGTDVGKTLVSAIIVKALQGDYWKPLQAGNLECSDTQTIRHLVGDVKCYPEVYRLKHALSPHHAAYLEGIEIKRDNFQIPVSSHRLVIESAGGVLVPIEKKVLLIDLFMDWDCEWVIVSRHYIGSINHTLLTIEALQKRQVNIKGIIFNGNDNPGTENFIRSYTNIPYLGHLYPEPELTPQLIQRYAEQWKPFL